MGHKRGKSTTAERMRQTIEKKGEGYWRHSDFANLPPTAVTKTFSRMVQAGTLQRVAKGLYYHARPTRFGKSYPSQGDIQKKVLMRQSLKPSGISAANLLGFTTQNAVHGEFATSANSVPRKVLGDRARLHIRRPKTWDKLSPTDASLLDFLRSRGAFSELSPEETKARLLDYFRKGDHFEQLAKVASKEPPRVRAMLGAIGQALGKDPAITEKLRRTLNPLSRFEFGLLRDLPHAKEWQVK